MNANTVQRSLVITFGPLAVSAGQELRKLLAAPGQPAAAVAVVLGDDRFPDDAPTVVDVLDTISRPWLRRELAEAGWALDRLDELGLLVLVDATAGEPDVSAAVGCVREAARARLGIGVGVLLVALCPEPGGDALDRLHRLLTDPVFDRGVVVLGRARLDGLRLESDAALAVAAGGLAHSLIVTPLRDAPANILTTPPDDWDHAPSVMPEVETRDTVRWPALTMGIARWSWTATATRAALAHHWVVTALDAWLAGGVDPPALVAQALGWLEQRDAGPEALSTLTEGRLLAAAAPAWQAPQPWAIRSALDRLRWPQGPVVTGEASETLAGRVAEWAALLWAECRDTLDRNPAGGLTRAATWVATLQAQSAGLAERAAARQEREGTTAAELARDAAALDATLDSLLAGWPGGEPAAWLPVLWRPWRWPRLALTYAALNRAGRALRELAVAQATLAREQAITTALLNTYARWAAELERLAGHLDEIGDMLRFVRGELEASAPAGPAPLALYAQLLADPLEEAALAASAVGRLGRQLDALDDDFVDDLSAAGWQRFALVDTLDAVAALPYFYPTAEAAAAWWQDLCEDAAPLWPASDGPPITGAETIIALSPDLPGLRAWVGEDGSAAVRWLPGPDATAIVVVRLAAVIV